MRLLRTCLNVLVLVALAALGSACGSSAAAPGTSDAGTKTAGLQYDGAVTILKGQAQ